MTWNYRVVRHPDGTLTLHEAYYDDAGRLKAATAGPISFVADPDEGLDGIVRSLEMALADANRHPVLDWAEIPGAPDRGGRPS
jgi:hypothetical protein